VFFDGFNNQVAAIEFKQLQVTFIFAEEPIDVLEDG
jgi:hypothetical protein